MITGYLGPEGSYSYLAAKQMTPKNALAAYASFPLAMRALTSFEADCIVLPIENSLNGGVVQNVDLLQATKNVVAVEECTVRIEHRLATLKGAKKERIERVYSHRQALDQCAAYLLENFPKAELIETPSTAASLKMINSEADAGIVGAHVAAEGITLSEGNIADYKDNFTHFLKVVRGCADVRRHSAKLYFSFTCPNVTGGLINVLQRISSHGLNMLKLQSRPIKDALDEFAFFVESEGDLAQSEVQAALADIRRAALSFKLLGAY